MATAKRSAIMAWLKRWPRFATTLLPLVLGLLYAVGSIHIGFLQQIDDNIYDARLRATVPNVMDDRIVIVDFDDKSLATFGWPWSRKVLADLMAELFDRQKIALAGFDMVFLGPDERSGLLQLQRLARQELRGQPDFNEALQRLKPSLDYDALLARAIKDRPVVLGYYFTGNHESRKAGMLPKPVIQGSSLTGGAALGLPEWSGFGANIPEIALAVPLAGFFNSVTDRDGLIRSLPLVALHEGQYYESLVLAMYRQLIGATAVSLGVAPASPLSPSFGRLENVRLTGPNRTVAVPVDAEGAALVPFRGKGTANGGSFRYISAADVVDKKLSAGDLAGKVVFIGTTAPGLLDLRVTPLGETYPGVELHANLLSGLLDGHVAVTPDYAVGYEVVVMLVSGLILLVWLPRLRPSQSMVLCLVVLGLIVGMNFWLYVEHGLVLPLAASVAMVLVAFALSMSYGYFFESRSRHNLATLFGTYVPPELVGHMVGEPEQYRMQAAHQELTVMFCDMRGFTKLSERLEPLQLQALLNDIFTRLSRNIRAHEGTIDKYMGDCVMAFWGAPVPLVNHANLAVAASLDMIQTVQAWNTTQHYSDSVAISVGIGLNTGHMFVGDMGSDIRRSYTVIGDAVNLAARLQGLSSIYGVDIIVGEGTRQKANQFVWQELDRVRVKGKEVAVDIFSVLTKADQLTARHAAELTSWNAFLNAYRRQDWNLCDAQLLTLRAQNPAKYLYQLYAERVASMRLQPIDPFWDGATSFETK